MISKSVIVGFLLLSLSGCNGDSVTKTGERWADQIVVKDRPWRADECSDYLVTSVCSAKKEFDEPGELPEVIRVGDMITHTNKRGKQFTFTVRNISVFTHSKDIDTVYGKERLTAKKGDTICTLYDEGSRSTIAKNEGSWLSRIVVKNCQVAASPNSSGPVTKTDLKTALGQYETVAGVFPKEFLKFSSDAQEAYVRGVLDGQYYLLESNKHPRRDVFVSCLNSQMKKIISEAKNFVDREGEQKFLMPWTLSRLVGQACPQETRVSPKESPKYTEASTSKKLYEIVLSTKKHSGEAELQKHQDAIDKVFMRGVLDGKVFTLYGHSYPKLIEYLECLSKPNNLDAIFRGMHTSQFLGENLDKSQAFDVAQGEALACEISKENK